MKAIKFSDKELEFLKEQYMEELANAEMYIVQIKDILKKLGASTTSFKEETMKSEPKEPKRRGRKPKAKQAEPAEKKKRGRKPRVSQPPAKEKAIVAAVAPVEVKKKSDFVSAPLKKVAAKQAKKAEEKPVKKIEKKPVAKTPVASAKKPKGKKASKRGRPKGTVTLVRLSKPLSAIKQKTETTLKQETALPNDTLVNPAE